MPIDYNDVSMDLSENCDYSCKMNLPLSSRDHLPAYIPSIPREELAAYKEEYESKRDTLQYISFTEYATFRAECRMDILNEEIHQIRSEFFGFPIIMHSDELVDFYTGLPNASQFYYISSLLQRYIFRSYINWDDSERHGFLNHTLIALMKLRLNISDQELAQRFGLEPYMVNMTLRTWLHGLYVCIYKTTEDVFRLPKAGNEHSYSKILDIVEVCFETPDYTRRLRGDKHETRKAVLLVRSDGYINFASSVVSANRPDRETIQGSRMITCCSYRDFVGVHPYDLETVRGLGIDCGSYIHESQAIFKEAVGRLCEFRILAAIPTEYASLHGYIFPVCAALSNFFKTQGVVQFPPHDLPDPQYYDELH